MVVSILGGPLKCPPAPNEAALIVDGGFYADPPDVKLTPADHEQLRRKQAYERDQLAAWFG